VGDGVVQALKKEFEIHDTWSSYEIHAETPKQGVPLTDRFPADAVEAMFARLQASGAPYGITFANQKLLSNSRLALAASEFAKDQGKFEDFHEAMFRAYFTDGKDIGDIDTLLTLASAVGLDAAPLRAALEADIYGERLALAQEEGRRYGVTGTPTFIINGRYKVVGAQPLDVFRNALNAIAEREVSVETEDQ